MGLDLLIESIYLYNDPRPEISNPLSNHISRTLQGPDSSQGSEWLASAVQKVARISQSNLCTCSMVSLCTAGVC